MQNAGDVGPQTEINYTFDITRVNLQMSYDDTHTHLPWTSSVIVSRTHIV